EVVPCDNIPARNITGQEEGKLTLKILFAPPIRRTTSSIECDLLSVVMGGEPKATVSYKGPSAHVMFDKLPEKDKWNIEDRDVENVEVRKTPLNKKEIARKEEDIVTVYDNAYFVVHESILKVDLTAYVEKHEFYFDVVLDEHVSNDEVIHLLSRDWM
ncbi:hypothetical protein U1Q18_025919, partial [Sarracenia purpurea var. burkii]